MWLLLRWLWSIHWLLLWNVLLNGWLLVDWLLDDLSNWLLLNWRGRLSNHLRSLSRKLLLLWLVEVIIHKDLLLNLRSKEPVSIIHDLSLSHWSWNLLINQILFFILDSAVLNQVLSLFKESFVLSLEYLELLKGIISDFLEFSFILPVNSLLDILPIIM